MSPPECESETKSVKQYSIQKSKTKSENPNEKCVVCIFCTKSNRTMAVAGVRNDWGPTELTQRRGGERGTGSGEGSRSWLSSNGQAQARRGLSQSWSSSSSSAALSE